MADGRLSPSVARARGLSPIAAQTALQSKLTELRGTYASLPDELSGRMPLSYVQLVQILTDVLILFTPFALVHTVGPFGVIAVRAPSLKSCDGVAPTCALAVSLEHARAFDHDRNRGQLWSLSSIHRSSR